jgi:hypothetical protein
MFGWNPNGGGTGKGFWIPKSYAFGGFLKQVILETRI